MTADNKEPKKKPCTALAPYKPTPLAIPDTGSGTLADFIRAANRAPILTPEREHELAVRLHDKGDMEAAGELIMSHLRLVISIARQYQGYGLPFSDLIQEGNIGLMKAVKRFNPHNGARLVTFAMTWIRSEIQDYVLKNWRLVKVATTKSQRKLFFNLRKMKDDTKLLGLDDANRIAEQLEVKPSEVFEMEQRMTGADVVIDEPSGGEKDSAPEDWLFDEGDDPDSRLKQARYEEVLSTELPEAVKKLDPRSRRIIEARWLFDESKDKKGATLADLAAELGVSQERVRQLEKKAFAVLKSELKDDAAE